MVIWVVNSNGRNETQLPDDLLATHNGILHRLENVVPCCGKLLDGPCETCHPRPGTTENNMSAARASKTRSNRPGWSVAFRHPVRTDSRGHRGLKVRRGLGTVDDAEADRLIDQLNELLEDQSWWSGDRRTEAERKFSPAVVSAFFDGIEAGSEFGAKRDRIIPLPTKEDGYSHVLFLGTTGAGKTTLLRHVVGSDPVEDRFPSTSTAKTTTADIEIITAPGQFRAAVTFMPEHEVRAHIEECLEEACLEAVQSIRTRR